MTVNQWFFTRKETTNAACVVPIYK